MSRSGRLLVGVYTVFALAAGARAVVQLATRFDVAPVAYLLSLGSAVVYLVAMLALRARGVLAWRVAVAACTVELAGVLAVGSLTALRPDLFADETVWSWFGAGYGFVPLVLPVLGLWWLSRVGKPSPPAPGRRK